MRTTQRGVTLMELLVVVAIVGILASIAIPTYRQYAIRTNRSSAKIALSQTAQSLERCYNNSTPYAYNSAVCAAAMPLPFTTQDGFYTISGVINAQDYTLTATPQNGQAQDGLCANFILNSANQRTVTGSLAATPNECWQR